MAPSSSLWRNTVKRYCPSNKSFPSIFFVDLPRLASKNIEGFEPFSAVLLDTAVPQIASALRKVLPFKGHLIHSAWSGSGVRALEAMNLPCVESHENSTYFPAPGDICFTVGHNEFTIFYGDASPAMPSGKVRESVFAIIEDRIMEFQQACMLTRLTGLRPFSLQFV